MSVEEVIGRLHWLGHDSFRVDGPPVIYFDPWRLPSDVPAADVVLVSHEHFDHCSPADVQRVTGPQTVTIAGGDAASKLPGALQVRPGDRLKAAGLTVKAVHAYNITKFRSPGVPFHPKEAGHVGYIVTLGAVRLYFAGDTDHIPEMANIDCDVALLPVSGTYVMTVEEAVEAARTLGAKVVVPMHYGSGIGTEKDGDRFAALFEGQTVLLEPER